MVNEVEKTWLFKLCDTLEKVTLYAAMTICASMLIVAWVHVIRRDVFNNSLTWSEEFLRFSLVWFALLSASIIHKKRGHLGIVTFREMMPKKNSEFFREIYTISGISSYFVDCYLWCRFNDKSTRTVFTGFKNSSCFTLCRYSGIVFLMSIYGVAHIIEDFKVASKEKNN